jgi:hypothetical protein
MKNFEYIVMTPPPFRGSAGIRFLNEFTDDIRATGRKAHRLYSVTTEVGLGVSLDCQTWYKSEPDAIRHFANNPENCIVIHGENQDCANFMGMNVARYYLNRIGALKKIGIPREGEFKIAWDTMFCDDPDFILRKSTVRYPLDEAASLPLTGRTLDLSYIGKAAIKNPNLTRVPNTLELKRDWPNNDDEYFYLLKNTNCLYTYDSVSSVIDDAITMGVLPVLMTDDMAIVQKITEALNGCVAHIGDDMQQARENLVTARSTYLKAQQGFVDEYKRNLEECCLRMEQFFGGA